MENQKKLNEIFRNLNKSLLQIASSQFLQSLDEALSGLVGFEKACLHAKIQLLRLFKQNEESLSDQQLRQIGGKIKLLSSSNDYLLEEGLINIYIQMYDKNKKINKTVNKVANQLNLRVLRYIDQLIKYFFFQNELKHFRKYKNHFKDLGHQNLQGLSDAMQNKIKVRVWQKKSSELFKLYIKSQEANKNKQLCRICYKKFQITYLANHVQNCGKKTFIKQQLAANYQKRIQIIKHLQMIAYGKDYEDKDFNIIHKIIQFYKNLKNDTKKRRRMSLRCQDAKMPLFFYECQINLQNQKTETKLLSQLTVLQNRAFYLDKKLTEVEQIQSGLSTGQDNLKISMNCAVYKKGLKKFNSISSQYKKMEAKKKALLDSNSSISSYDSQDQNQSHQDNKQNVQSPQKQQTTQKQKENQPQTIVNPPIIGRRLKKKFTEFHAGRRSEKSQSNASEVNYGSLSIKNFEILKLLGKGAFGRVYLVRRNRTEDIYALKVIKIDKCWGEAELQAIKNQYGVYKQIAGDHLVTATFSFQQKNAQFFVLQYMPGGDFSNLLQQNIYLQEKDAQFYLAEIILAIQHLHNSGIIHRDLKPENIILDAKGHIKLTDFGLSQFRVKQKIGKILQNEKIETKQCQNLRISMKKRSMIKGKNGAKIIGTPDYIAPEIIEGISLINPSIDWWSLGVIAYEMLIGCRPFCANTVQQILTNIESGQIQWPEIGQEENMISPVAADLIKSFLNRNFQQRLGYKGVEQIKKHPFFKGINWENLKNTKPPALGQGIKIEEIDFLKEDKQLRKQIEALIKHEQQQTNRLQELKNYVRYDLLTAETLQSVKTGTDKKQRRIRKLKSITTNLQTRDPQWAKSKLQAQQLSQKYNSSQVYISI